MKKFALTIVCLLIAGTLAFADDAAKDKDKSAASDKTLTGCLSGPNAEGAYLLKTDKGEIEVGGNDQLKSHVGHEVKLTGEYAKSGSAIGENEKAEKSESGAKSEMGEKGKEKNEKHFKVEKIDHVADTCSTK
jgi:hypothetical protein